MVIFNHESYLDSTLQFREGSRRDVNELIQSFGRVGYNIEKNYIHNDLTRKEILNVLEASKIFLSTYTNLQLIPINHLVSKEDHTERNCLIVIFLSHGEDSNKLHVNDGYITTTEIWQNFASCPTLQNKPKLFVFQVLQRYTLYSAPFTFIVYRLVRERMFRTLLETANITKILI